MTTEKAPSTTESPNPDSEGLDQMSGLEIARLMNAQDRGVVEAVEAQVEAIGDAAEAIAERLGRGGRLFYLGAGTSGRLGILDASECPPTFDTDPCMVQGLIAGGPPAIHAAVEGAEDDRAQGAKDLQERCAEAGDCVVGIAASGTTPYVCGALEYARSLGCATVAIVCNDGSPVAALTDHPIEVVVGPEVLAGSTRLKAGTATKMVLNMLSTGAMVLLGKTYGNLMVDLQATNTKLRARATRLLVCLTDLSFEAATTLLERCEGQLKTAVVVHRRGIAPAEARAELAAHDGRLRETLA